MTLTIYTNFDALRLQRGLAHGQTELARTISRLSSGLRVSQASDDAAGLAVAARMQSQIRGLNQAVRNAGDVMSSLNGAESQLAQMTELLQRVRELGIQAANGTLAGSDRVAMNGELRQVLAEYDRVAASASYNGQTLLNGSAGTVRYQVGADANDSLSLDWSANLGSSTQGTLQMISSADLRTSNGGSGGGFQFAGTYTSVALTHTDFSIPASPFRGGVVTTTGTLNLNYAGAQPTTFTVDGNTVSLNSSFSSVGALASAVQAQLSAAHGGWFTVTSDANSITITKTASAASATSAVSIAAGTGAADISAFTSGTPQAGAAAVTATFAGFSVDGHRVFLNSDFTGNDGGLIADIQSQLDASPGASGVYQVSGSSAGVSIAKTGSLYPPTVGSFVGTGATNFAQASSGALTLGSGDLQIQWAGGQPIDIVGSFTTPDALANSMMSKVKGLYASIDTTTGKLKLLATQQFSVTGTQADASGVLGFDSSSSQSNGNLGSVNLLNTSSAVEVLMRIDSAIDAINQKKATFGAYQSRLLETINNLQSSSSNLTEARGRIVDADYAQELVQFTRQQVIQQAGQAMLAQANTLSRSVLKLLL